MSVATKLSPLDVIDSQVKRLVATEADEAGFYRIGTQLLLQLSHGRTLRLNVSRFDLVQNCASESLKPAVGWLHDQFLPADALTQLIVGRQVRRLIQTRGSSYDRAMIVLSDNLVLGVSDVGSQNLLFVRSRFDEHLEKQTSYWNYFSGEPVDYLGGDFHNAAS